MFSYEIEGGVDIFAKHDESPCKYYLQEKGECPFSKVREALIKFVKSKNRRCDGKECIKVAKEIIGTNDEKTLYDLILPENIKSEIYKTRGPADSTDLLNQFNIDGVLKDLSYATIHGKLGDAAFFHIPFEMRDFQKNIKSELRDLNIDKLASKGFKYFACVLNTDVWAGQGKHWVCIFGTVDNASKKVDIEYFNSSGNGLNQFKEIAEWCDKLQEKFPDWKISIREVMKYEIQKSDTECGVWCLWYIKSRLEGKPASYFSDANITDSHIIESRKYLFTN